MALLSGPDYVSDRTGSQLYVSRYGEPLADTAVGNRPDAHAMTPSTKMTWLCCSKPVLLIPLAQELTRAGLDENQPVAGLIRDFSRAGKGGVTLAHLLTHTVPYQSLGISWTDEGVRGGDEHEVASSDWAAALAAVCGMPLSGRPGGGVTYTALANWLLLAAVIEQLTGRPHEESVRAAVLEPLGMACTSMYVSEQDLDPAEFAPLMVLDRDGGAGPAGCDVAPDLFSRRPGLACRGPARELARVIECMAGWRQPGQLSAEWRDKFLRPCRLGLADPVFNGADVHWSMGLCADPVCYGLPLSRRAVGHTGAYSSMVFADLDLGITVSFICNGMVPKARDWARKRNLVRAIYADLGVPARNRP
jgi:CubicO group peptidase (beta-lactamase class C family)